MYTQDQIKEMYEVSLMQRKQAYAKKLPKFLITAINNQLIELRRMMQEVA
jgi:hypothetical protein